MLVDAVIADTLTGLDSALRSRKRVSRSQVVMKQAADDPPGTGDDMAKVNVNTAGKEQLDAVAGLRGHGFEIVRYREERGRFTDLRQLDEVPGLSGKVDDQTRANLET